MNLDKTLINWNKSTISSFEKQIGNNSPESSFYKTRLLAFKAFADIVDVETVNTNSIRYRFLQGLTKDLVTKDFYIVEIIHSGEQVEIKNYVIYPTSKNLAEVHVYNFIGGNWVKKIATKKINLGSVVNFNKALTKFGSGFNQEDLIVTKLIDCKVYESDFYLYTTLSDLSNVKKVLMLE